MTPEDIAHLREEANALAHALDEHIPHLRGRGAPVPVELRERINDFSEHLTHVAEVLNVPKAKSLTDLEAAMKGHSERTTLVEAVQPLKLVAATVDGYEEAIGGLTAMVEFALQDPALLDDHRLLELDWLKNVLTGAAPVGPGDFVDTRNRLTAIGLDEHLALGLVAGHLKLPPADESQAHTESRERKLRDDETVSGGEADPPDGSPLPLTDSIGSEAHFVADPIAPGPERLDEPEEEKKPADTDDLARTPSVQSDLPSAADTSSPGVVEEEFARVAEGTSADALMRGLTTPGGSEASATESDPSINGNEAARALGPQEHAILRGVAEALRRSDLSLAFWLLRHLEAHGHQPPISAAAIAALMLADRAQGPDEPFGQAYEEYGLDVLTLEPADLSGTLVSCAGALRASITLPYGGGPQILGEFGPRLEGSLAELAEVVAERAPRGDLLQRGKAAAQAREAASWEAAEAEIVSAAAELADRGMEQTHKFVPAVTVWRQLGPDGPVGRLLLAVQAGAPDKEARELLLRLGDVRQVDRHIDDLFRQASKHHTGRLEASARDWVRRNVSRAVELGRAWLALHEDSGAKTGSQANGAQLGWLRQRLRDLAPGIESQFRRPAHASYELGAAAGSVLEYRWRQFEGYAVRGERVATAGPETSPTELLGASLARATTLPIGLDFSIPDEMLIDAGEDLLGALERSWVDAFRDGLSKDAHHLTRVALEHVESGDRPRLEQEREQRLAQARDALRAKLEDTRRRLDTALREQLLSDAEHGKQVESLETFDLREEDIASQYRRLDVINRQLETARVNRCDELRQQLDEATVGEDDRRRIEQLLTAQELAVAAEQLARLEAGEPPGDLSIETQQAVAEFVEFDRVHDQGNLADLVRGQGTRNSDFQAFRLLANMATKERIKEPQKAVAGVRQVLNAVGLESTGMPVLRDRISNRMHLFEAPVRTKAGICPVPEYGSRSNDQYRVLLASELPPEREVVSQIKSLSPRAGGPILLICGSRVDMKRRLALAQRARQDHVSFLVVDPVLLAFTVTGDVDRSRAERFFAAALAFAWVNPYVTHGAVPEEMFFGRTNEMETLLDPTGSAFIYGGRQLGKSALLVKALHDFHDPDEGRCAVYLDLDSKRIGHGSSTDLVWSYIGHELERAVPTNHRSAGRDEATVRAFILEWVNADPRRELRVFLDETDHFLEEEASAGEGRARMHNVIAMRDLMRQGGGRLKFVLAGLHSVQRFLHLPNQPLAQMGAATPVGPLRWHDGQRLIEEPMTALGYVFEDFVVDRILTLTNRHPSLIQHVCRALTDHMSRKPFREVPVTITRRDLEEVYEDRGLRGEIRKRFDWTLDLDPRYRVLAYTLALESLEDSSIRARGLTGMELSRRAAEWWAEGFLDLTRDAVVALCDEMVDLRVFVLHEGRYRLWSPNIMQLLGTEEEIAERLLSDTGREQMSALDASSDRRPLGDADSHGRSPLSYADERRLLGPEGPSVRLVFGTAATQVENLGAALTACEGSPDWPRLVVHTHKRVPSPRDLSTGSVDDHTVSVAPARDLSAEWLHDRVRQLTEEVPPGTTVVVVFDADSIEIWEELLTALELDEGLAGSYRALQLQRWDSRSLANWLDDIQMPVTSDEERQRIVDATGGWPALLGLFLEHAQRHDRRVDPTLASFSASEASVERLISDLALDRVGGLRRCAGLLAEIPGGWSARTVVEFAGGELNLIEAQRWLQTLVLAQAAVPSATRDEGGREEVYLEPCLGRALT
jgi:hypothetical protein